MARLLTVFLGVSLAVFGELRVMGDWPTLRGTTERNGRVDSTLKPPFQLLWATEMPDERMGTAVEPIVSGGKVFAATHAGSIYALDADSGAGLWRFQAGDAFLHSPAVIENTLVAGCADGDLYALNSNDGKLLWATFLDFGGMSASPCIADGRIFIGTRKGDFCALDVKTGRLAWRVPLGAPIRQTAAYSDGRVYVTAEDLRVRCFDGSNGKLLWTSEQLEGQTARDYYPIIVKKNGRTFLIVRTNPVLNMGQRIGRDRTMLCRNAGIDDSGWQKIDGWIKSDDARGTPELWAKEQKAIGDYLKTNADAQTFFVLDAKIGEQASIPAVLWIAGCQGAGAQPALTADGKLLVFYRSAYGNWNHGVAPLVALGLLDLEKNQIMPLFHQQGKQPRWNCFWGTADESQNFVVAGDTLIIIHQGTLSGFDLAKKELFPIFGERDTYGGFRNPSWARNEWHGPARSGVALSGKRIYWQTGSRILCVASEEAAAVNNKIQSVRLGTGANHAAPPVQPPSSAAIREKLNRAVREVLSTNWASLFTDPGLSGRVFSFDDAGELFEALGWAYPHLDHELQSNVVALLKREWDQHMPFTKSGRLDLKAGSSREWFRVPAEYRVRLGTDKQPHPFANVYAASLFFERCGQEKFLLQKWPDVKSAFEDFVKSSWRLDSIRGDAFANQYLSSMMATARLAERANDATTATKANAAADQTSNALIGWWNRIATNGTLKIFNTSSELDPYIGKGGGISFALAPHRHKLALFDGLTPEIAEMLRARVPEAVDRVWETFALLYRTWPLVCEERQVHTGENFVDPPELALAAFKALAWLKIAPAAELAKRTDLPFCRADLYYIDKLAIALSASRTD